MSATETGQESAHADRWRASLSVLSVGLLIVTLAMAFAPASAPAQKPEPQLPVDLSVDSVEVTQAIQTPTNAIPLVAPKGTAVRAYIGVDAEDQVSGVTGRLHVFVNGSEVTPAGGVPPSSRSQRRDRQTETRRTTRSTLSYPPRLRSRLRRTSTSGSASRPSPASGTPATTRDLPTI